VRQFAKDALHGAGADLEVSSNSRTVGSLGAGLDFGRPEFGFEILLNQGAGTCRKPADAAFARMEQQFRCHAVGLAHLHLRLLNALKLCCYTSATSNHAVDYGNLPRVDFNIYSIASGCFDDGTR